MFKMVEISLTPRFQMIWITGRYLYMWILVTCSISTLKNNGLHDSHLHGTRTGPILHSWRGQDPCLRSEYIFVVVLEI